MAPLPLGLGARGPGRPNALDSPLFPFCPCTAPKLRPHSGCRFDRAERFEQGEELWVSKPRPGRPASAQPRSREIMPEEVRRKVIRTAASCEGAAVVVEMLWSSTEYLPLHGNGEKYREMADRLENLLAGRLCEGQPVDLLVIDEPIPAKGAGLYDRFSAPLGVASNGSYAGAAPKRLGAFEVHVVTRAGPEAQHSLLHSRLWSRRWPEFRSLLPRLGVVLLGVPPSEPLPVPLRPVNFRPPRRGELTTFNPSFQRRAVRLPPDPGAMESVQSLLMSLDSPTSTGWFVTSQENTVLARSGDFQHKLVIKKALDIFAVHKLDRQGNTFLDYFQTHKLLQHGMPLADMVRNFFESQLQWPQRRQSMELSFQSAQRLSDLEEEQGRQLQGRVALGLKEQRQICKDYVLEWKRSVTNAKSIYVQFVSALLRRLPGHQVPELDSVQAASKALQQGLAVNAARRAAWKSWQESMESWQQDDSQEEKELFKSILQQRPDLARAWEQWNSRSKDVSSLTELEDVWQMRIQEAYAKVEVYQARINALRSDLQQQIAEYNRLFV